VKKIRYPDHRMPKGAPIADRLARYTVITADGCRVWTGHRDKNGYGRISIDRRLRYAHRVAYELYVGPIPDGAA
jgi:hypothetical protein